MPLGALVDTVIIDGRIVMRKREVLTIDEDKLLSDIRIPPELPRSGFNARDDGLQVGGDCSHNRPFV